MRRRERVLLPGLPCQGPPHPAVAEHKTGSHLMHVPRSQSVQQWRQSQAQLLRELTLVGLSRKAAISPDRGASKAPKAHMGSWNFCCFEPDSPDLPPPPPFFFPKDTTSKRSLASKHHHGKPTARKCSKTVELWSGTVSVS